MAGERETLREKKKAVSQSPSQVLAGSVSLAELGKAEGVFRAAEASPLAEPSIERWAQFNERVMGQVSESLGRRPTLSERWRVLLDRFAASDGRWKEWQRRIVTAVVVVVVVVVVFLAL
jgi:hypothetical protein